MLFITNAHIKPMVGEDIQKGSVLIEDGKIVAICDVDESKLQSVGDSLGIAPEYRFTNYFTNSWVREY